jgi:hypothetical protein
MCREDGKREKQQAASCQPPACSSLLSSTATFSLSPSSALSMHTHVGTHTGAQKLVLQVFSWCSLAIVLVLSRHWVLQRQSMPHMLTCSHAHMLTRAQTRWGWQYAGKAESMQRQPCAGIHPRARCRTPLISPPRGLGSFWGPCGAALVGTAAWEGLGG